jgi:hypothetical protein
MQRTSQKCVFQDKLLHMALLWHQGTPCLPLARRIFFRIMFVGPHGHHQSRLRADPNHSIIGDYATYLYLFFFLTGYSTRSCSTQIDLQNIWSSGPSCICMPCPCSTPVWCAHTCLQGLPTVPVLPLCRDASDMSVRLRAQYNGIFLCSIPTFPAYYNSMGAKSAARTLSSYCEPT